MVKILLFNRFYDYYLAFLFAAKVKIMRSQHVLILVMALSVNFGLALCCAD